MLFGVIWGLFGLILGSFANVVILRYGKESIGGRSRCPACGKELSWLDLIPLVSYLALGGKCRACKERISLQYPLVEACTGGLFFLVGISNIALPLRLLAIAILFFLLCILVYDLRHMLIPDRWSYAFSALALVYGIYAAFLADTSLLFALLAGPLIALPLGALWFFSHGAWMGLGDVKIAFGIGWLLGIVHGFTVLSLSFVIGAIVGVCVLLPLPWYARMLAKVGITRFHEGTNGFTMHSEVPFGPFLILALCIVWLPALYGYDITLVLARFLSLS